VKRGVRRRGGASEEGREERRRDGAREGCGARERGVQCCLRARRMSRESVRVVWRLVISRAAP
jgi:hypothetical protein